MERLVGAGLRATKIDGCFLLHLRGMKTFLFFLTAISFLHLQAQTSNAPKSLHLQTSFPKFLRQGDRMELATTMVNHSNKEVTGQVQLELINAATHQSVDGWFLNTFPNQYFTIAAHRNETTTFPVQVPYDFSGQIYLRVSARVDDAIQLQDSLMVLSNETAVVHSALHLTKQLFLHKKQNAQTALVPLNEMTVVQVGDTIVTQLKVQTRTPLYHVVLKDDFAAGLTPLNPHNNSHVIYNLKQLHKGSHRFSYASIVTQKGTFNSGMVLLQKSNQLLAINSCATLTVE